MNSVHVCYFNRLTTYVSDTVTFEVGNEINTQVRFNKQAFDISQVRILTPHPIRVFSSPSSTYFDIDVEVGN